MSTPLKFAVFLMATACAWHPVRAQMSAPPIPSVLPDISTISPGNAAGVLRYCVSNQLVSSTSAGVVLDALTKKPDVVGSPDFSAGEAGQILGNGGKTFSVGQAPSYLKSRACDMVLTEAKHSL